MEKAVILSDSIKLLVKGIAKEYHSYVQDTGISWPDVFTIGMLCLLILFLVKLILNFILQIITIFVQRKYDTEIQKRKENSENKKRGYKTELTKELLNYLKENKDSNSEYAEVLKKLIGIANDNELDQNRIKNSNPE